MSSVLEWEEVYSFQKFLPLLTRWHLKGESRTHFTLKPKVIHKKRKVKGKGLFIHSIYITIILFLVL